MARWESWASRIAARATDVAALAIITLLLVQLVVVVLRYVFSFGVPWASDLVVYLFFVAALLPAVSVVLENNIVRVDVLYQSYPDSLRSILDRLGLGVFLFPAAAYSTYASWAPTINAWRLMETSPTPDGLPGYFLLKTLLLLVFMVLGGCAFALSLKRRPWSHPSHHEEEIS